ncbi:dihydroorotate dehydrogenase electron transfer subunit [Dehalobacter sp. DCM]|uniref:dihydroorotate dehydrogenase electron transfer subunit n=1 Tax=Dehalobacter sp. DCM TaxID=2907827 RepID=UPI003081DED7|nr:dihydroorotate dehydrogenase electron transfer subunit [Dehalobacter sp. DCM]
MYLKERVVENRFVGHPALGIYKLVLKGQAAKEARPGQFLHIKVNNTNDPLLRRPLSIAGIDSEKEELTIYYRVKGKGTELLSQVDENDHLSILGPLGTEFLVPEDGELLLIAGGIGIFPLYSLIQAAQKKNIRMKLLWGGENRGFLESAGLSSLITMGLDFEIATMDGSYGEKGLVTLLLDKYLEHKHTVELRQQGLLQAAACGPNGMLKAVTDRCLAHDVPIEVSLEERMACGVGACVGCVCTVMGEDGQPARKRVCSDGPVFKGREVVWNADF